MDAGLIRIEANLRLLWTAVILLTLGLGVPAGLRGQQTGVVDPAARRTGTLAGTLLSSEDGLPVEGLRVRVLETGAESITDATGQFALSELWPRGYTLQVFQGEVLRMQLTDVLVRPGEVFVVPPQQLPVLRRAGEVPTLAEITISASRLHGLDQEREWWTHDTVTGSFLHRISSGSFSQRHLGREVIDQRSAITPAMLLATVPEVNGLPLNVSSVAGTSARGDNTAISLRALGSGNTLVLLNGRRLVAHPIAPLDEQSIPTLTINVNQLPMHGFHQIDVLKGGASSTYGFDAVAGVVNYRMDTDYQGEEVGLRVSVPEAGGTEEVSAHWMRGGVFAAGRGRYVSVLDVFHREPLYMAEREFMADADKTALVPAPFNQAGSAFDDVSNVGRYPRFQVGADLTDLYFRPLADQGDTPVLTSERPSLTTDRSFFYNVNESQIVIPRSDRVNLYEQVEYDLTPTLTAFGELSAYHAESFVQRQPIPYDGSNDVDRPVVLSIDNPYNPYGTHFWAEDGAAAPDGSPRLTGTPQEVTLLSVSLADAGPEQVDIRTDVWRALAGLRGELSGGWSWESGLLYSEARTRDVSRNEVRESLLQAAARRSDAQAYNPFGYTFRVEGGAVVADQPYVNPPETMATMLSEFLRIGSTSLTVADIRTTGAVDIANARVAHLAFGAEFRAETFSDWRAPYAGLNPADSGLDPEDNDFIQASPTANIRARRNVAAFYFESAVPLFGEPASGDGRGFAEVSLAGRYENYDDFGDAVAPRFGVNWLVSPRLQVHASLDRSFRAPNLAVLHALPRKRVQTGMSDKYRRLVTGEGTRSVNVFYPGSPELQPEEAAGFNAGVVLEVPGLERLSWKLDYWTTSQSNVVGSDSGPEVLLNDHRLITEYIAQQVAAGVAPSAVDLGSGTAAYHGDPRVVRQRVSAEDRAVFDAYNAGLDPAVQLPVLAPIDYVLRLFENNRDGHASGFDMGVAWHSERRPWGSVDVDLNASYLLDSYTKTRDSGMRQQRRDTQRGQRLRSTATLQWRRNQWNVALTGYYVSSFDDTAASTSLETYEALGRPSYIVPRMEDGVWLYRYRIASTLSFDLACSYDFKPRRDAGWLQDTTVRFKVTNLTDEAPPLTSATAGVSMQAHAPLVAGRTWGLELVKRF